MLARRGSERGVSRAAVAGHFARWATFACREDRNCHTPLGAASHDTARARRLSAYLEGFSLHAAVHLDANDREGLARLCGYGARPPLSQEHGVEVYDPSLGQWNSITPMGVLAVEGLPVRRRS